MTLQNTGRIYAHQIIPVGSPLVEMVGKSIVNIVEEHTLNSDKFAVHQKTTGTEVNERALLTEQRLNRPLIGYGGERTFPLISDPSEQIEGGVGIIDGKLVYSKRAIPLQHMRDSYLWGYSLVLYYVIFDFIDVIKEFIERGYKLFLSSDLLTFEKSCPFTIVGEIILTDKNIYTIVVCS